MSFCKLCFVFILIYSDVSSGQKRKQAAILCPKLNEVKNGNKLFQDTSGGIRNDYESVTEYTCKRGYYLNGDTEMKVYKRTCQADGTWDGKEPVCDVPRCKQISDFHNGTIRYFGDRKLNSQAFYSCDDAFSLFPRHVKDSKCEDTLKWKPDPPKCYRQCNLTLQEGMSFMANSRSLTGESGTKQTFDNGTKLKMQCDKGYRMKDMISQKSVQKKIRYSTCNLGHWTHQYECTPEECSIPKVFNASLRGKAASQYKHTEKITFYCDDGFNFDQNVSTKVTRFETICNLGHWANDIPQECKEDGCRLDIHEGSYYYVANTNESITSVKLIEHDTNFALQCMDTYDLFNDKNEIYLDKPYKPTATCYQGKWRNAFYCKKSCIISKDRRYMYKDREGEKIEPGSKISDATTLNVTCSIIDPDEYYNSYFDDEYNTDLASYPTITCANNTLSQLELDCPEVETCLELQHGNVTIKNGYFMVSCLKEYSLNLTVPEDGRCICEHGTLKSVYGDQIPHCIPDNCTIPYTFDGRLSVTYRNFVSLSGGSVVAVGEFVYLNCSKSYGPNYEPFNRRFTCSNGLWTEAERDRSWSLGYNGQFPRCRAAICEPNCTNGGVCYKDDTCRCRHLTEGKLCENVICDIKCSVNGGKCVGPGKCGDCPQGKFGINCEQDGCLLPKDAAKYKDSQTVFSPGETLSTFSCPAGFYLSSRDGMTCQDGNWSTIVKCVEAAVYLISAKTGKDWYGDGTDANVYITLHGLNGSTDRIYLQGSFEADNLDETRVPAKDVRPITSVEIGHDGRGIGPDWYLEYVSIYVENMEEYYVFRHNDWVKGKTDIDLPRQGLDQERCIASFDSGLSWYPKWKSIRTQELRRKTSSRGCKQACINLQTMDCVAVYYNSNLKTCWGFADRVNFIEMQGKWNSVYLRTCKHFD